MSEALGKAVKWICGGNEAVFCKDIKSVLSVAPGLEDDDKITLGKIHALISNAFASKTATADVEGQELGETSTDCEDIYDGDDIYSGDQKEWWSD